MTAAQTSIRTENGTPVWVRGEGPTVIFLHGVLVDHRMWGPQVEELSERYRVCCFDMLGHGAAPDPPGERVLEDFVAQTHEVVEHFSDQGPPVLAGFSMGGLIAQAYAVKHHAALCGLILMSTVHDRSLEERATVRARFDGNVERGVENAVESGLQRWFKQSDYELHADKISDTVRWIRSGDFAAKRKAHAVFVSSDAQVTGRLSGISCPALVMTGAEDGGSTPAMARKMASLIPNARLRIIEGQHHMLPLMDQDRVNADLFDFLSRLE